VAAGPTRALTFLLAACNTRRGVHRQRRARVSLVAFQRRNLAPVRFRGQKKLRNENDLCRQNSHRCTCRVLNNRAKFPVDRQSTIIGSPLELKYLARGLTVSAADRVAFVLGE
jgi:hypothetical protein